MLIAADSIVFVSQPAPIAKQSLTGTC